MDVAIFGAGVAGLAAAAALKMAGHSIQVYEKSAAGPGAARPFEGARAAAREGGGPLAAAGMGFLVTPDALQALELLGVELPGATPLRRYRHLDESGHALAEHDLHAGAACIRRSTLVAALLEALPKGRLDTQSGGLEGLEFDAHGAVAAARLASGRLVQAALYVGADGVRSRAREALYPCWPTATAPVLEIVGLTEDPHAHRRAGTDFRKFHARAGGLAFGLLPADGQSLVWYLQFDARRLSRLRLPRTAADLRRFVHERVDGWADEVQQAIAATDFERVHLWFPVDAAPLPRFDRPNLVLAGDAAHPLSPFTSQGVSSAIMDALALTRMLLEEQRLDRALSRYSRERRRACLPYVERGRQLTRLFLEAGGLEQLVPIAE
ncbi:MAG TPA: NAD(P)/FAD-dependent oxidoreductase [Burkholderiaceae bacterium]